MASSGSYSFSPSLADLTLECFERLGLYGPSISQTHMISARRSMGLVLMRWSSRGVNQWAVGDPDIQLPMLTGSSEYYLPSNTVSLLDCYLRSFTPDTDTVDLGNALTSLVTQAGEPIIAQPYGDPIVIQPGGGALSCVAGSLAATLAWPNHRLSFGSPLFWGCPTSIGGLTLSGFSIVSAVIDRNTLQFQLPSPALESQSGAGGTTLFYTQSGSGTVTAILPGHGLAAGSAFEVEFSTAVGGLTLLGSYTIVTAPTLYSFTFAAGATASSTAVAFENGGQINLASQLAGTNPTDIYLSPLSRNDYAMLPDKFVQGRPTQYWFDRTIDPKLTLWPVPPTGPPYYGFVAYRMRELQDANPQMGQTLDAPRRFLPAFSAELTMWLAEKWKPALFKEKAEIAQILWDEAAGEDREKVATRFSIAGVY